MEISELITNIENINLNDYNSELYLFTGLNENIKLYLVNFPTKITELIESAKLNLIKNFSKKNYIEDYSLGKAKYLNLIRYDLSEIKNSWDHFTNKIFYDSHNDVEELPHVTGYFFRLSNSFLANDIFIFFKKNPIIVSSKIKYKFIYQNEMKPYNEKSKIFTFSSSPHFIILDNKIYSDNLYFEDIFGLEKVTIHLGEKCLENIKKIPYLDNGFIEYISKTITKNKIKSLASLEYGYINDLNDSNIDIFCNEFGFNYDPKNKKILCTTDEEKQELYKVLTTGTKDIITKKKHFKE